MEHDRLMEWAIRLLSPTVVRSAT